MPRPDPIRGRATTLEITKRPMVTPWAACFSWPAARRSRSNTVQFVADGLGIGALVLLRARTGTVVVKGYHGSLQRAGNVGAMRWRNRVLRTIAGIGNSLLEG